MGATPQLESPTRRPPRSVRPGRSRPSSGPALSLGRSSDEHLARRATRGDHQALGAIFERYEQELYRFCLGLLGEPQDAQDALQNTMVKTLRALPGEKREIALRPWLYRVAHNEAINLRRTRRETQTLDRHLLDAHSSVAERAEHRERLQWLLRDFSDLPDRQRTVLVMRELSGLDFADIAAALGTSGAVVRQSLYEARRNLEQMDVGRSLRCDAVARVLSDADGRTSRRRDIRAHLRDCPDCRRFQDQIQARKETFAGIAPLSAGAAAGLFQSVLGGSGAGGLTGAISGGAAQSIGTAGVLKAVATVAAMAVIGTAAVERGGPDHPGGSVTSSTRPSRTGQEAPQGSRRSSPRQARSLAEGPQRETPSPSAASTPDNGALVQPSAPTVRPRASRDRAAPTPESSAPAVPVAGPTPSSAPAEHSPQAEKQPQSEQKAEKEEEKAAKREEKAAEAEAKGKPEHPEHPTHSEHPTHPEHPAHPAQSQKPSEPPAAQGESPPGGEATSTPEAEVSPESDPSPGPNGKAKGHEKQLTG